MNEVRGLRLVIVGTGTGVGKTHVGCALLRGWAERHIAALGLKPIETGIAASHPLASPDEPAAGSDALKLRQAGGTFHVKHSPYAFPEAVSPHLAARRAGSRIELRAVRRWVGEHVAPVVVIETAGGLFTPLADGATNLDLALALRPCTMLLVAPDRLGVLHDVTATLGLAAARGQRITHIVLSAPETPDPSTGRNGAELARLGIVQPLAIFPRADERDPATLAAAGATIAALERYEGVSENERY